MFRFSAVVLLAGALVSKQMNAFVHMGPGEEKRKKKNFSQFKILLNDARVVSKRHTNKTSVKQKKKNTV